MMPVRSIAKEIEQSSCKKTAIEPSEAEDVHFEGPTVYGIGAHI